MWLKIGYDKLQLDSELATLYFDLTWDFFTAKTLHRSESCYEEERSLNIGLLVLVLFIQLLVVDPVQVKRSLSLDRLSLEKWPSPSSSSSPVSPASPSLALTISNRSKILDDDVHAEFVRDRLGDLRRVFENEDEPFLEALDALVGVRVENGAEMTLINFLEAKSLETDAMVEVLKKKLKPNYFGVLTCIKSGKRLSWLLGNNLSSRKSTIDKPKMATNAHRTADNKLIVLNQLTHKTLARRSSTLAGARVKMHRCQKCFIYLLSSLRSLTITKCSDCTIVTGPISGNLSVRRCSNVNIISLANRVMIGESINSTLNIFTPNKIIFNGETCRNVTLGPFNTNYHGLQGDMEMIGMQADQRQMWRDPIVMTKDQIKKCCSVGFPFKIMKPESFKPLVIPFADLVCEGGEVLIPLDNEYQKNLDRDNIDDVVSKWEEIQQVFGLDEEQKKEFEKHLDKKFESWIATTGRGREMEGLRSLGTLTKTQT